MPAAGVAADRDSGTTVEVSQQERSVSDRGVALLRIADAVVPDGQHVAAGERLLRQDVPEQVAPGGVVALERDGHNFSFAFDAANVFVALLAYVISVFRLPDSVPREGEVFSAHGNAVAPMCVVADVVGHAHWPELEREPADQVRFVRKAWCVKERAADHRRLEDDVPEGAA